MAVPLVCFGFSYFMQEKPIYFRTMCVFFEKLLFPQFV